MPSPKSSAFYVGAQDLQPSIEPGPLMASSVAPTVLRNGIQVGMGIALSSKSLDK
jgi:hypothetical protein